MILCINMKMSTYLKSALMASICLFASCRTLATALSCHWMYSSLCWSIALSFSSTLASRKITSSPSKRYLSAFTAVSSDCNNIKSDVIVVTFRRGGGIAPLFSVLTIDKCKWSDSCPFHFTPGETVSSASLCRKLGWLKSWSGHYGEDKNLLHLLEIELRLLGHLACPLVTILTELSPLLETETVYSAC